MLQTAKIFQNGMLLQRGKEILIWGNSEPETVINVEIQGKRVSGKADKNGEWQVTIPSLKASEGETINITTDKENLMYEDVAVGEVWVAGGQSNMEYWMRYEKHKEEAIKEMPKPTLRFYDVPEVCYDGQLEEFDYSRQGIWRTATKEDLQYFSAIGYYFQNMIAKTLNVPVGVIGCNWGGTISAAWMNPETVRRVGKPWMEDLEGQMAKLNMEEYWKNQHGNPMNNRGDMFADPFTEFVLKGTRDEREVQEFFGKLNGIETMQNYLSTIPPQSIPGSLYEYMVKTIAPYGISGFLWYQGESDDVPGLNVLYKDMLTGLISDWRTLWKDSMLPFMVVQLPGFEKWLHVVSNEYPIIRKCQQDVADTVSNVYLCSISDAGEQYDIHPGNKKVVGERLALLARKYAYGDNILADAPRVRTISREKNTVTVEWENAGEGIEVKGDTVEGLHIFLEAEEKYFTFKTERNKLILSVDGAEKGDLQVKFAKTSWYRVNLYNSEGIPAIPFEAEC